MGFFDKFKSGLQKTHSKLVHEIKRIVTSSPRLKGTSLEELEAALIGADLGMAMTDQIIQAVKKSYETQGSAGADVFQIASREVEKSLSTGKTELVRAANGPTVISIVGVNGTGKTTTAAKLAHSIQSRGETVLLAACDTFRAAAIEQIKLWGERLNVPVISGADNADPAAIAHDAVTAAVSRNANFLLVDTAGRGGYFRHVLTNLGSFGRGSPEWLTEAFLKTTGGDPVALLRILDTFVDTPEADIAAITQPTLVASGIDDEDNGPAADLAATLPDASLVALPGNHMSAVTKPELGAAIAGFLST